MITHRWRLTDERINALQVDDVDRIIQRAKAAHFVNVRVRINGKWEEYEADWIKHMRRENPMFGWLRMIFCRHSWSQRYWGVTECGYLCTKCGRIQYRKGDGGPMPPGTSRPTVNGDA